MDMQIQDKVKDFLIISKTVQIKDITDNNYMPLWNELKHLRNFCAKSQECQRAIMENDQIRNIIKEVLFATTEETCAYKKLKLITWQLLANAIVGNAYTQQLLWRYFKDDIFQVIYIQGRQRLSAIIDIILMIMFNSTKSPTALTTDIDQTIVSHKEVLQAAIFVWQCILQQQCTFQFEFLHIIFERYIVTNDDCHKSKDIIHYYNEFTNEQRLIFLDYLHQYLKQDNPNGLVCGALLQHLSNEFKLKSDCILRLSSLKEIQSAKPQEAYGVLKCIASATGSDSYTNIYHRDHSLFLNISSSLRCLIKVCQEHGDSYSMYKTLNKLEEVAPSGNVSREYQQEITYELKTLLVRCVANLLYKNPTNQNYSYDTQLIPALLECTNVDARNPLIKEWSILAIRNACDNCPKIQEIIGNITHQGVAYNETLKDLNLQMGSLRIAPNRN